MNHELSQIAGTQAIGRALLVLRTIASEGRRGARVAEIVAMSALPQATVSRILTALLREGVVERDPRLRKYFVGPSIHELGLVARADYSLPQTAAPAVQWLAEHSEDTVYLSERRGLEASCTMAVEGIYPIKALPLHVGIRRPLGVGAGGLAILAAMDARQAGDIIRSNRPRYPAYGGINETYLAEAITESRTRGWAIVANKATPGMTAIGAAIFNPSREPVGAISISAIASRMTGDRQRSLARMLLKRCAEVTERLTMPRHGGPHTEASDPGADTHEPRSRLKLARVP